MHCPIIGFYTICNTYPLTIAVAKEVKKINPLISIIFGGPQASLTAKETLQTYNFVDVISVGEGEKTICNLVDQITNNKSLHVVQGIVFRDEDGTVVQTDSPPLISGKELSDYTVFDIDEYNGFRDGKSNHFIHSIEAGRGCPYGCSFCSTSLFWGRTFRVKDINNIINELRFFNSKYGIVKFRLEHDLFTANKTYVSDFCRKLKASNLNIIWGCSSRIDILDLDLIHTLKSSKCNAIYIGFESGSQRMQRILNKNIPVEQAHERLLQLHQNGFDLTISFIYGFPEEDESDFFKTVQLLEFLYCNGMGKLQLHKFIPLPVTEETGKVKDILKLDHTDIDISIFRSSHFCNSLSEIIEKSPSIHSCFYTFPSVLRDKYKHMDILITCISLSYNMFKLSIKFLIEKYGLINIYLTNEEKINKCFQNMQSETILTSFSESADNQFLFQLALSIVADTISNESFIFSNIAQYEKDLYQFTYFSKVNICHHTYSVDIFEAVKSQTIPIAPLKTTIKFTRENNIVSISR